MNSGWSIVYIEGTQVKIAFLSLKIAYISVDPDEMPHYAAFRTHLEATSIQRINFLSVDV